MSTSRRWPPRSITPRPSRERGGRPPFPTEPMVRVLLIRQLFNLGDEQMEFQLLERLGFQCFVGLRTRHAN
ncbi:MAG TPA: transposase [Duganella sp.]|nr:transposase [Duganella sp.]